MAAPAHVGRVLTSLGLRDRVLTVVFTYEAGTVRAAARGRVARPLIWRGRTAWVPITATPGRRGCR